jgi:hypothetical protein
MDNKPFPLARKRIFQSHVAWMTVCSILGFASVGCERGPKIVPVEGSVRFEGAPLRFGSVSFQPARGQPAIGHIQPDGTFRMTTFKLNDGATVGPNKVRITAYQSQDPANTPTAGEQSLGKLLIPERYTFYDQSGLTADVKPSENQPFVFELTK